MTYSTSEACRILVALATLAVLGGCGGTKLLKEPEPLTVRDALAASGDARIAASLDWVIVRDGPGTWAKNADWDEYLVTLRNDSAEPVTVTAVGAMAGALMLAPVLVVGGVVRGVNNGKVNDTIEARQTPLPAQVAPGTAAVLDVFFPIAPSPIDVRIDYTDASGQHSIVLDTKDALAGLHLVPEGS